MYKLNSIHVIDIVYECDGHSTNRSIERNMTIKLFRKILKSNKVRARESVFYNISNRLIEVIMPQDMPIDGLSLI